DKSISATLIAPCRGLPFAAYCFDSGPRLPSSKPARDSVFSVPPAARPAYRTLFALRDPQAPLAVPRVSLRGAEHSSPAAPARVLWLIQPASMAPALFARSPRQPD